MTKTPTINRPGWLAVWAQKMRRRRMQANSQTQVHHVPGPDLKRGLVAHFGFDEASGNRLDDVHGYVLAPVSGNPGVAGGLLGNAAGFDSGGGYLSGTGDTTMFSPTADGFAVSVWVNFDDTIAIDTEACIAGVWQDADWPAGSSWQISSASPADGDITAAVMGSGTQRFSISARLNGWVHVCLVCDAAAGQWLLYFNGALAGTSQCGYRPAAGRLTVGRHSQPTMTPSDFLVDALAIWSRSLSATEVAMLFNDWSGLPFEMF